MEHPDGDPFAEADRLKAANSKLGKMEAKAMHDQRVAEALATGLPPPPPPALPPSLRSSQRSTPSLYGTPKRPTEVVVLNDSSDDDSDAVAAQIVKPRASRPSSLASTSASASKPKIPTPPLPPPTPEVVMRDRSPSPAKSSTPVEPHPAASTDKATTSPPPPSHARESSLSSAHTSPPPKPGPSPPPGPAAPPPIAVPAKAPRQQQRSPSPAPLPKPKPPPRTVRLTIDLPQPVGDVPVYSIADLARDAGFLDVGEEQEDKGSASASGGSGDESGDSDGEGGESKKKDKGKGKGDDGKDKMEGVESTAAGVSPAPGAATGPDGAPPKKRRRNNKVLGRLGGYDVEDPFVDDSDIALYEPQWYHRPQRPGYYVCSGTLALISDTQPPTRGRQPGSKNKPKFDADGNVIKATRAKPVAGADPAVANATASTSKPTTGAAAAAAAAAAKPRKTSAAANKDAGPAEDNFHPLPSVSSVPAFGNGAAPPPAALTKQKKKGVFSPELHVELNMLRSEVAKESFEVKNKFPPRLRPILINVALHALALGEYDDSFFAVLPTIFPYNLFTMKKLVKREIFPRLMENHTEDQSKHFATIENGIAETLQKQRAEFEQSHREWEAGLQEKEGAVDEKRKKMEAESLKQDADEDAPESGKAAMPTSDAPTVVGDDVAMGSPGPEGEAKPGEEREAPEPKWKFRFTEPMRLALYNLCTIEDEMSELLIEKQTLEKSTEKLHSALSSRKALYARVAALWPPEMMTTNQLSREMSMTKKKVDREKERAEA